jgi:PadR family transcriptional regulator PadR
MARMGSAKGRRTGVGVDSIYGTVDLLILRTLQRVGPLHGLAIAEEIERISGTELSVEDSALYPALRRLEEQGRIEGEWKVSERGRRARFYDLTPAGVRYLKRAARDWARRVGAIGRVLGFGGVEIQ